MVLWGMQFGLLCQLLGPDVSQAHWAGSIHLALTFWSRHTHQPEYRLWQVHINDDKALAFLEESSRVFEAILDAEDQLIGDDIERIMQELQAAESSDIVQHLVQELFHKERQAS